MCADILVGHGFPDGAQLRAREMSTVKRMLLQHGPLFGPDGERRGRDSGADHQGPAQDQRDGVWVQFATPLLCRPGCPGWRRISPATSMLVRDTEAAFLGVLLAAAA